MSDTFELRYGLFAIFEYADEDRAPYKAPKGEPPRRCQITNQYADECPCEKLTVLIGSQITHGVTV